MWRLDTEEFNNDNMCDCFISSLGREPLENKQSVSDYLLFEQEFWDDTSCNDGLQMKTMYVTTSSNARMSMQI